MTPLELRDGPPTAGAPAYADAATDQRAPSAPWWPARATAAGTTPVDPLGRDALLRRLMMLMVGTRLVMAAVGWAMISLLWRQWTDALPRGVIVTSALVVLGLTIAAVARLRAGGTLGENTFLVHLMGDVVTLTYLMAHIGDSQGLLLCLYLLPLSLAAYALTGRRLAVATGGTVLAVGLLLYAQPDASSAMGPHTVTHQASELVAMALVLLMAYAVAVVLRHHQRALMRVREAAVSEQGSLALASMAVRTADAISTPLATMSVLVHELKNGRLPAREIDAALDELTQQIDRCKAHISDALASAGRARADEGRRVPLDKLVDAAVDQCVLMTPALQVETAPLTGRPPEVVDERSLFDALVLLIQHCGRDTTRTVRIALDWNDRSIFIRLCGAAGHGPAAREASDSIVALAASLLGRWSGTVSFEVLGDQRCSRIELPRESACLDPPGA